MVFFESSLNGIISLWSFLMCLTSVYRKVIDFCILILYTTSLMNFNSCSFLVKPSASFMYRKHHLQRDTLTSFFPRCTFIAFTFLFALVATSNTMVNRKGVHKRIFLASSWF